MEGPGDGAADGAGVGYGVPQIPPLDSVTFDVEFAALAVLFAVLSLVDGDDSRRRRNSSDSAASSSFEIDDSRRRRNPSGARHTPLAQSSSKEQESPPAQGPHKPPQSSDDSNSGSNTPFRQEMGVGESVTTAVGAGVGAGELHTSKPSRQSRLVQSSSTWQNEPGSHAGQLAPPQSTDVSSISCTALVQCTELGAADGTELGALDGAWLGSALGAVVGATDGSGLGAGLGAGVLHSPPTHNSLRQSKSTRQILNDSHEEQLPPQSTSDSSLSFTPFAQSSAEGAAEGKVEGCADGDDEGCWLGENDGAGDPEGAVDGTEVGVGEFQLTQNPQVKSHAPEYVPQTSHMSSSQVRPVDSMRSHISTESTHGTGVGALDGKPDGCEEGAVVGNADGNVVGTTEGAPDGTVVGATLPHTEPSHAPVWQSAFSAQLSPIAHGGQKPPQSTSVSNAMSR